MSGIDKTREVVDEAGAKAKDLAGEAVEVAEHAADKVVHAAEEVTGRLVEDAGKITGHHEVTHVGQRLQEHDVQDLEYHGEDSPQ